MNPTLAWERVGQRFFRTFEGPALQWEIQPSHKHIRGSAHGGVLAVWDREDIIIRQLPEAETTRLRPRLNLLNPQGRTMGYITLDFGNVVDVILPVDETVIVISGTGLCRHYTDFGENFVQVHLPGTPVKALACGGGYVVQLDMEEGLSLAFVTHYTSAEPKVRIVSLESAEAFDQWTVLPANELHGQSEAIVIVSDSGEVLAYDLDLRPTSRKRVARDVPLGIIKASKDGSSLAFSNGSQTLVYTGDFHSKRMDRKCSEHEGLHWIDNNALALVSSSNEIEIINVTGQHESTVVYFDDDDVVLVDEVDGLRVLGNDSHSLLVSVSAATAETFKLGSTAPSAVLLSCIDYLDIGSPRADQNVKLLGQESLSRAVDTCISAALAEVDSKLQKRLMRAAGFGKSALEVYDSTRYLNALTELRIGNALRNLPESSMFVTNAQISSLGYVRLIRRLELRQLWPTAVSIARLKKMPIEPIYTEWACWFIQTQTSKSDEELLADLEQKLAKLSAYPQSKMARRALEQGRQKLALVLLEREPVAADRVLIMMEMEMMQQALEQALRSGNPALVDYVLVVLAEHLTASQLMSNIGWNQQLVERYTRMLQLPPNSKEALHQFLIQVDQRPQSLHIEFEEVLGMTDATTKTQALHALEKKYNHTSKKFYQESHACGEWAALLEKQKGLEAAANGTSYVGLSAAETVAALLKGSYEKIAEQIRAKLGISERQFWWLRLNVLSERRDWHGLWDLSQKQRPPIGFRPFFDAVFEAGNLEAAASYVELISEASIEEKVELLMKCNSTERARDLALKSRDQRLIALVQA